MSEIRYFLRWSINRLQSPTPFSQNISPEEARQLHEARKVYAAVILHEGSPRAFIESSDGFFAVNFIDGDGRVYLSYSFRELEPGRVFLEQATFRKFDGNSLRASSQEVYIFAPDGTHYEKVSDFVRKTSKRSEPRNIDVSGNWSPYPSFGHYEDLMRVER